MRRFGCVSETVGDTDVDDELHGCTCCVSQKRNRIGARTT